jgi:MoaA/NifB/PqqE/SkfB family radical SAM enzyme
MTRALSLIVTRSCNLACRYCPVGKDEVHLDAREARAAVRRLAGGEVDLVRLTGGEPTLNWPAVEAVVGEVEALRRRRPGLRLELCTNGTTVDEARAGFLERDWIDVVVSIDGRDDTQRGSGRVPVGALRRLVEMPGLVVTQTIAPERAHRLLDDFLFLWQNGVRAFNFLPVYYVTWSAQQRRHLAEALAAVAEILAPHVAAGRARVRNLTRMGSVPLFNDDVTVDADGRVYRTNLVLADAVTAPLLEDLRARGGAPPDLPPDLRPRLERLLPARVRDSMARVDGVLDDFVEALRSGRGARRPPPEPGPRVRPERLEFHISYDCTNACVFCSEAHRLDRWAGHEVRAAEVRRTLLSHARAGGTHVNLTGGEPSMHPAFEYAVSLAQALGMRVYVGTNGVRLCDPGFAARTLPRIDELSLSLHASRPELHDDLTGRRGSFDDLMRTRDNASRLRPEMELFVNAVVTRRSFDDLPRLLELCNRLDVRNVLLSNMAPEGRGLDAYGELAVRLSRWRSAAGSLAEEARRSGITLRFFGLPLCALGEARVKSNDLYYDPRVTVERARGPRSTVRLSNVATRSPRRGRRFSRRCRGCAMRELCGGVFAEYLETFGDAEIEPIGR